MYLYMIFYKTTFGECLNKSGIKICLYEDIKIALNFNTRYIIEKSFILSLYSAS